jgi:hypothetical protein
VLGTQLVALVSPIELEQPIGSCGRVSMKFGRCGVKASRL